MYQVTIKGRNLKELKKAVADINDELSSNTVVKGMEKDLTIEETIAEAVEDTEEMIDVPSPYKEFNPVAEAVMEDPRATASGIELDDKGMPWDKRIHTEKRTKVKAGTWKYRKGLDAGLKEKVEIELRASLQRLASPTPIPALPVTPVVAEAPAPVAPAPVVTPVVAAPVPVVPVMTNGGHTLATFSQGLPMILAKLISDAKIDQNYVNTLKDYFKVDELWNVNDLQKAEMFETFATGGLITKVM